MSGRTREGFPRQYARTRRFTCGASRDVKVANDGSRVLFLRSGSGDDPVNALWLLCPTTGVESLVADPARLQGAQDGGDLPAAELARRERARESASGIVAYDALADLSRACFAVDGRVYLAEVPAPGAGAAGNGGTGDVPGVDPGLPSARVVELPSSGDAFDPRLSPDGSSVAYVSGSSLRITGAGGDRRLVGGSTRSVSWGSAEFIAAEEMGRSRGHWWSPDGGRLLVTRVDTLGVSEWWISSPVDPSAPPRAIRYPAAGSTNATVGLSVVDLDGTTTDVDWHGDATFEYLADVAWPTGGVPTVVAQTRDQRTLVVLEVDPSSGATTERTRIVDDHWVDLVPGTPRLDGGAILTVESRDGTNRLVVDGVAVSPDGLQVRSVAGIAGDGAVVVLASGDPLDVEVVRIARDGATEVVAGGEGVRSVAVGGGVVVVSTATLEGSSMVVLPGGHVIASHAEEPVVRPQPTFHVVGDRSLRAAVLVPDRHDGSRLPVLLDPYGGPHGQRVQRARGQFLTSQWFADQGFAVVVADGRGTPGRGPAWERAVGGDLAAPTLDDQVDALHGLAALDDRLDLGRVAIRGWSFGGYLAALAVLRRPDVFHAAIAGAPVTDWRLYDTHYTERYLGDPASQPGNYARTDLCAQAALLERPLLLIHGLADDNVVAAHTLQFSRALLEAGRPHRVLPISGVTHMTPQPEVAENLLLVQLEFLREALGTAG
ncbi:MAG: prolyl oligopeptidase family serine peptidase [Acidimicrobiales bacterium]|nr:prolyl oligopeptidase family serine peptidase [Acidimicrobiales bacterium]